MGASPAAAQSGSWTGPYFGGRLGYTSQPNDKDERVLFDTDLNGSFEDTVQTVAGADAFQRGFCGGATTDPNATNCRDRDGTEWAAHAGYDVQFGTSLVAGVVAEYGRSDIEDGVSAFSSTPAVYTLSRRLRDHASLRARAGISFGNTLAYATGGLAYGKIERRFTTSNTANSFDTTNDDDNAYGYRYGGGVEQRVSDRFSIGVQYLRTSLKDNDFQVRAGGTGLPVSNPFLLTNAEGTDFRRSGDRFTSNNLSVVASFHF